MQPFTPVLIALTLAAAGPVHAIGEIHVPGDFPDPQSAIYAALPGDLIVVHGGTWGPITIDKPLQLLGDPAPSFKAMDLVPYIWSSPITLAGSGTGTVVLSNVQASGTVPGLASHAGAAVTGGGFEEIHVFDSQLLGPTWTSATEPPEGCPGMQVSIPFVLIERSTVAASDSIHTGGGGFCWGGADGVAGLWASGTVVVLDSIVRGGSAGPYCMHGFWGSCSAFSSCSYCAKGVGGAGIECQELHHSGSTFVGGTGADWYDLAGAYCGKKADGPPIAAATEVALNNNLLGTGKMKLGSTYGLLWTTPGPSAWLFFSLGLGPPLQIPGLGYGYLDFGSVVPLGVFSAPGTITFAIPALPVLLGQKVALQAFDPTAGTITRPVAGTLQN